MKKLLIVLIMLTIVLSTGVWAQAKTVSLWGWRPQDAPIWEKVTQILKQKGDNITIAYEAYLATEYDAKLLVSLQGGAGPDLYLTRRLPSPRTQPLIDNNFIVPLNGLVDFKNFTPATLNFIQAGGKTWGVPFANQVVGIFYNTEIFAKYGLKEPQTWDELVAICKTLQSKGVTPFFVSGKDAWTLAMQHAMCGVSIPGEAWIGRAIKGEVKFTDAAMVDLNRRLNDLKVYYQKDFLANSTQDMDAAFALGQAAMVFYGVWGHSNWVQLNPEFKYGYFPVPALKAGDARVYVYMDGSYGLNSASKNRDAALKVLNYSATPEYGTIFSAVTGEMTAMKGAALPTDKPVLLECYGISTTLASRNLYWVGSPFDAAKPSVYDLLQTGMQEMYLGKATPAELAQKIQDGVATWYPAYKK